MPTVQTAYRLATPAVRRRYNKAFFERIEVRDDYTITSELAEPWDTLLDPAMRQAAREDHQNRIQGDPEGQRERRPLVSSGVGAPPPLVGRGLSEIQMVGHMLKSFINKENHEDLLVLAELIEAGSITPAIDRCYPLSSAPAAIQYLEQGRARGKVVITVQPPGSP